MNPERRRALALAAGRALSPAAIERVARESSPDAARWAFAQLGLRDRARARFGDRADAWLWDADGLAMATHPAVALYHASLFPEGVLVADLTAGLGSDLAALADRGPVVGYERDPERATLLRHNVPAATVIEGDGLTADAEWIFADPARRTVSGRLDHPGAWSPDPREVAALIRERRGGAIKLSPGTPDHFLLGLGGDVEFVSFGGECREALVRFPSAGLPRGAVHVESGARMAAGPFPARASLGAWLFDADPALVRAGATGGLELGAIDDSGGYLTGDDPVHSPWLRVYAPLWSGRLADAVGAARRRGLRPFELKQRGAGLDPARELRRFGKSGEPVSLVAWRDGASIRTALAIPVAPSPGFP